MFYDLFCDLCAKKNVSPTRASLEIGLSKSTATKWKNTGATPQGDTLNKIATYFGVSADYLLGNEQKETPGLTKKDERDIKSKIDEILDMMSSQEGLMFDGDPLSPEALQSIRSAMELGMTAATLKNKEKYNPNKNKKD